MDEKALESLADQFRQIVLGTVSKTDSPSQDPEQVEEQEQECTESMDENTATYNLSNEKKEPCSSDQEQTFPVLKKIFDLSSKVENLKKEHTALVDEVKVLTTGSFPVPEVCDALQSLNNDHELLRKKFLHESSERRRLYNEVIEPKGNIRVFCRCRPLSQDDISNGSNSVVDFDTCPDNELQIMCTDSSKKSFKFDHVFKPDDNQEDVFAETAPVVTSVLDGYNVCIFAYGQTGTGKTFTMEGTPESRGVNYRTLEELFRLSKERSGVMKYELFVSMLEVYNEKIRDLLIDNSVQPAKKLEIKQAANGAQEVPGLSEVCVHGTDEVWELLNSGSRARSVGSTNANELSSRSHCLLRINVKGDNIVNGLKTKSHLWLVDLAGSERVGKIEVEGERLKESQFINKSLSALGDVISALASKTSHVPYRNSKLTHMLQSSLGGDCKTLMFVQISPSATDVGETICSLNFATRVRGIESGPVRKQTDIADLAKYKQLAEKQKHDEKEITRLQDSLRSLQLRVAGREQICRSLQEKVRDLENQLAEERKLRLKQETKAFSAASAPYSGPTQNTNVNREKKPPLGPSRPRMALRGITNFLPPPSPAYKPYNNNHTRIPSFPSSVVRGEDKENTFRSTSSSSNPSRRSLLIQPRRYSVAVRPNNPTTMPAGLQARRRVSIAAFRPEPSTRPNNPTTMPSGLQARRRVSIAAFRGEPTNRPNNPTTMPSALQPRRRVSIAAFRGEPTNRPNNPTTTPSALQPRRRVSIAAFRGEPTNRPNNPTTMPSALQPRRRVSIAAFRREPSMTTPLQKGSQMGRQSFLRDARYSRIFSPIRQVNSAVEGTPAPMRSSSKFMGSPPTHMGSWRPKHPTVIALQKKQLVWSPLKFRGMNRKSSLLPSASDAM